MVSDGIVAPDFEPEALDILKAKKGGGFIVLRADPASGRPQQEAREVFGMRLVQDRNNHMVCCGDLEEVVCGELTEAARRDLLLGLVAIKYTQSNSVGYALDGQMIGIGAGQQSRVDCTKLAGSKGDLWYLRTHPKVLALAIQEGCEAPGTHQLAGPLHRGRPDPLRERRPGGVSGGLPRSPDRRREAASGSPSSTG